MSDKSVEQEIQAKGLNAPRIRPADIEANIVCEKYFTAEEGVFGRHALDAEVASPGIQVCAVATEQLSQLKLLTFCILVLRNGFTVTGESACASPENFDAEIGRRIARENAIAKVWPLMGYELRSKLARQAEYGVGGAE